MDESKTLCPPARLSTVLLMDARYSYDESAEVWPYFVLTLLGVVLIPLTLSHLFSAIFGGSDASARHRAHPAKVTAKSQTQFRQEQRRKQTTLNFTVLLLALGWLLFAILVRLAATSGKTVDDTQKGSYWDPWQVLDIASSATDREIKSAYRKLSLQYHPDKVRGGDDGKTKEDVEAFYVEITKAYRALTDPDTKENFERYGHPDGPQPVTHGIALPAFLVGKASPLVVVLYVLAFGIGLPYVVGSRWTRSQLRTRRGLLQKTAAQFVELCIKEQPHFIVVSRIIAVILKSADMDAVLPGVPYERRLELLNEYLDRSSGTSKDAYLVATTAERLLLGLLEIASEFKNILLCRRIIELHRTIVQAVPLDMMRHGEYLQLPGSDLETTKAGGDNEKLQVSQCMAKGEHTIPRLLPLHAEFKVSGEDYVPPNSQMYLQLTFMVLPLGATPPKFDEDELQALSKPVLAIDHRVAQDPSLYNRRQPALPSAAYSEWFPSDSAVRWVAFIVGDRDNRVVQGPIDIANMNLTNLKLGRDASKDSFVIGTLNFPISSASPPFPGQFAFRLELLSTTYFGCDINIRVPLDVKAAQAGPSKVVDEGLDEEEESHKTDGNIDESSDEEDDLSDIDTDTEPEDGDGDEDK